MLPLSLAGLTMMWLLGVLSGRTLARFLQLFLVLAADVLLIHVIQGRRLL
jgi:hypothetical protein